MLAYQCDENGIFIKEVKCQESPRESGTWLLPSSATFLAPPDAGIGKQAVFDFVRKVWEVVSIKTEKVKEIPFNQYSPNQKLLVVKNKVESLLQNCSIAMERMVWADWVNNPIDPDIKAAWAKYRQALLSIPTAEQDQTFFIKLQTLESFPWPEQPTLPPETK